MSAIVICLRNTTNWSETHDLQYPRGIWHVPGRNIHYGMTIWKKMVPKTSFPMFRKKLKEIASANWSSIDNLSMIVDATNLDCDRLVNTLDSLYDDYILLPTDDDDWFCPDIFNRLSKYSKSDWIKWPCMKYDSAITNTIGNQGHYRWPESNCYAVTKAGFAKIPNKDRESIIRIHTDFPNICEKNKLSGIVLADPTISMYNYHPASISHLVNGKSHSICHKTMPNVPPGMEWASKNISQMVEAINRLIVSVKVL